MAICILLFSVVMLSACDDVVNKVKGAGDDILNSVQYDYAIISFPDGTIEQVELSGLYNSAEGETYYYIYGTDGYGYIVDKKNCALVNDPDMDIDVAFSLNYKKMTYVSAMVKMPDGTVKNTNSFEGDVVGVLMFKDEDGKFYSVDSSNYAIKCKIAD